jgi:glycosyltransferase involved in cell wall biosynthesis
MAIQAAMLSEGLRQQGHKVINVRTNPLPQKSRWRRIPLVRGLVNFLLFLFNAVRSCSRSDVLHIFSHSYLSFFLFTLPAVAIGRLLGRPIVIHYHGGAARAFLAQWGWLAVPVLRQAKHLIVPSGFLSEVFADHQLNTVEVPNILPLDRLKFRLRHPLRPRIIVARHLEHDYNPACAVRTFAIVRQRFPDAMLTIAGDGSEKSRLLALCREMNIEGAVTFTGNVDASRMMTLYDQADIYLNCSRVDNQPVSMLEAYALGLPVVSTAVGGIPFMATNGVDALLAPSDDDSRLAGHIVSLLEDGEMSSRIAQQARHRAEACSWPPIYDALRRLYQGDASK